MNHLRTLSSVSIVLALCLVTSQAAWAALIAQDSFDFGGPPDYNASTFGRNTASGTGKIKPGNTTGQNPTSPGFAGGAVGGPGAWTGPTTSLWQVQDVGLSYPNQPTSGGSVQYDWNVDDILRQMSRPLTSGPTISPGGTYWMSGMVSYNALEVDNEGGIYGGFGDSSSNLGAGPGPTAESAFLGESPKGWRIGLEASGSGGLMDLVFRHQDAGDVVVSELLLPNVLPGTDNLVIVQGTADVTGSIDELQIWVNPSSPGGKLLLPIQDALELTSSSLAAGAFDLFLLQGWDIDNPSGAGGALLDEFRLGTTLADVAPNAELFVPEPCGCLWLFPAALILHRRRRTRMPAC